MNTAGWLENMEVTILIKNINLCVWDREFELPIEYDCYANEKVTREQLSAIDKFTQNTLKIQESKMFVEKYCKQSLELDKSNQKKNNIFSYIKPDYLYVKREEKPRVAIMCKYKYDLEHGIAIVFSQDGEIKVGLQDIIL